MRKRIIITAAILLLAAAPMFAAVDAFMKLDGIPGPAQGTHPGWIQIESFSFGMPQASTRADTVTIRPSAGGSSNAEVHDLTITKLADVASPKLALACATGKHFPEVTLELNGQRTLLQDVVIASVQKTAPMGDGSVREILKLKFGRDATHQSPAGVADIYKQKIYGSNTTANATIGGAGGAPSPTMLQSVRLAGQNQAIIVVCDVAGGMGAALLQRAFQMRQPLPELRLATNPANGMDKSMPPPMQFTFTNVVITGGTASGGGCSQFSLRFQRYSGPPAGFTAPR